MRLISLHPSSTHTGVAIWSVNDDWTVPILVHRETIVPEGDTEDEKNLGLAAQVVETSHRFACETAVLERYSPVNFGKARRGMDIYKRAVDAVRLALVRELGPDNVYGVVPQTWKGSHKKKDAIRMVNDKFNLGLRAKDEHEADAIGVGLWFIHRMSFNPIPPIGRCTL